MILFTNEKKIIKKNLNNRINILTLLMLSKMFALEIMLIG